MNTNRPSRVETAKTRLINHLFRYGGYIGAYLIVGGYDPTGPWLYNISADGSSHHNPYLTMGSGSLAAMSVFEANYRDNFTKDEAVECAIKAIESGIRNDLGSGSNVDIVVIDGNGTDY